MATLALKFSTTNEQGAVLPGGHAYLVLPEPTINVRELLQEKVRAEFRKARAAGIEQSSLEAIFGRGFNVHAPLDEMFARQKIINLFRLGYILLLIDGKASTNVEQVVELNRRTGLALMVLEAQETYSNG